MSTKLTGRRGEEAAAGYLERHQYKILDRNFSFRAANGPRIAEVDIVAKKKDCYVFVEVKTIKGGKAGFLAQDKVNVEKQRKIAYAAEVWLINHRIPLDVKWQVDVVAVQILDDKRPKIVCWLFGQKIDISHFKNVAHR